MFLMQLGIPRESNGHWKSSVARMLLSLIIYADALDTQCAQYGCIESLSQVLSTLSPRIAPFAAGEIKICRMNCDKTQRADLHFTRIPFSRPLIIALSVSPRNFFSVTSFSTRCIRHLLFYILNSRSKLFCNCLQNSWILLVCVCS